MTIGAKKLIEFPLDVRWGDLDALGHVNNSQNFVYAESARVQWLSTIEVGLHLLEKEGPVVLTISNHFILPIAYPQKLMVVLFSGDIGHSSFVIKHKILSYDSAQLFSEGECKCVWVNYQNVTSMKMPDKLRHALQ